MKTPILRVPSRDARDADYMALIAIGGGIYLWWGRSGLPVTTLPWITGMSVASIVCGVLLWLRAPAAKWLGVLVFVAMLGLSVRHLILDGWSFRDGLKLLLRLLCAYWMGRIDYSERFVPEEE